jgi:hypothetical protein
MFEAIKLFMSKYIIIGAIVLAVGGGSFGYINYERYLDAKAAYSVEVNNSKAEAANTKIWEDRYGQEHSRTIQFKESLDDFKSAKDSITLALVQLAKINKINIKSLQQVSHSSFRVDTTILRHVKAIQGDTTIDFSTKDLVNTFTYKGGIASSHVGIIDTESTFWSAHKETIAPPDKFFVWRWFQKKQTVVQVDVIHSNTLVKPTSAKFILLNKNVKALSKE